MAGYNNNSSGQASAQYCTTDASGHQFCYYPGPPATPGKHAYRVYKQQVAPPGQVYDIVEAPCHGRNATCNDTPILSWPAICPAAPYVHQYPSCQGNQCQVQAPSNPCSGNVRQFKPLNCS